MMRPWAARIGARRSPQPTSDVLTDPLQPSERLLRLSRAAPALLSAPRTPARGRRLRSEGTETVPSPPKTALLPVVFFVGRRFPYLIAPVPSSMLILILSSSLPTVPHPPDRGCSKSIDRSSRHVVKGSRFFFLSLRRVGRREGGDKAS